MKEGGPRERVREKGAGSLQTEELLRVLIGSGNAQASVLRIAKRTFKVLERHGPRVTFEQLVQISGLGAARACQVLAALELSSRYPVAFRGMVIDSRAREVAALSELRYSTALRCVLVTLNGASRQLQSRSCAVNQARPSELLRFAVSHSVQDGAAQVLLGLGASTRGLEPTLFDLSFARDMYQVSRALHVRVLRMYSVNRDDAQPLEAR